MSEKEIRVIEKLLDRIRLITLEKIKILNNLTSLEFNSKKNTVSYSNCFCEYKMISDLEKQIYNEFNKKEYLIFADKILTQKIIIILDRLYLFNESKKVKVNSLIADLQRYELDLCALHYLDKSIDMANQVTKELLIRNKYLIAFTNVNTEEFMIENYFESPKEILMFTDYYINEFNLPSNVYVRDQEELYIDTIVDYINSLSKYSIFDMTLLNVKIDIHTKLIYIKSIALKVPKEVLNSIIINEVYSNELIGKIINNNLKDARDDKEKVLKLKEVRI